MTITVALYARVSSEQQVQSNTIDSQVLAIQERIKSDGYTLLKEYQFIDDGYSGSTLMRPGLEALRDAVANNLLDRIYVHSPDRLARKYAYQYLLIEEFNRLGVNIIFLNNPLGNNPESDLLLQVQGIISEYERMKIMERMRRGKIHSAKQGSPSVLGSAPYGYRYTAKRHNGFVAYEVIEKEAEVIRLLFSWIGYERISIRAATHRLTEMGLSTPTGKNSFWDRKSIYRMLKNPAYKGMAAFGKTKVVPKKLRIRPSKGHPIQSKKSYSLEPVPKEKWILIPVPPIIDESLFDAVQEQLEENKRFKRERVTGARYLLQGLVVCGICQYAYCGNSACGTRKHHYYSCVGTRTYANRVRMCDSTVVHAHILEELVWKEVEYLLNDPSCLEKEYQRRIDELTEDPRGQERNKLNFEKSKMEKSIERLIDSYADGIIEKSEFEPRIRNCKQKLHFLEQNLLQLIDNESNKKNLKMIVANIEDFSILVKKKLKDIDWQTKRDIVIALIKKIEIGKDKVNIIFRVDPYPTATNRNILLEDCRKSI